MKQCKHPDCINEVEGILDDFCSHGCEESYYMNGLYPDDEAAY